MHDELRHFARCFFHEDYEVEFSNPDEAVMAFADEQDAQSVAGVLAELDQLLASPRSEAELYDLWINELGASYDPTDDGITYRDWFAHVRELLTGPPNR